MTLVMMIVQMENKRGSLGASCLMMCMMGKLLGDVVLMMVMMK